MPWFLRVCSTSLLKTLWEKEKLLVTSNFSFFTVFSICFENFRSISSNLKLSFATSFSLEESKFCRLGMSYATFSHSMARTSATYCLFHGIFIIIMKKCFQVCSFQKKNGKKYDPTQMLTLCQTSIFFPFPTHCFTHLENFLPFSSIS